MKEGWTYKKLGEVFRTYSGGTPSKSNKANYENGTIPWIRSGEVCQKYITESELFISEEGLKNSSAKYYPINTILVAMYGATAAQCGILKFKATSNQAVCGILPHVGFLPEFVYAYFTYIKENLAAQAQGGAQPNISQEKIKKVLFPCIPLAEQRSIVTRLDTAFSHIDALKANAERQVNEARKLFQAELTECMKPKEGWEEKMLGEVATEMYRGSGIKRDQVTKEGTPCVRYGEIYTTYNVAFERCVSHTCKELISSPKYFEHGDLLFAITGESVDDIGKTIAYMGHDKCLLGGDIICMKHEQNAKYLSYALSTPDAIRQKGIGKTKLKVVHTNAPALKSIKIPLPPLAIQQAIVSHLDSLSSNIRKLEELQQKTIAECDALKQAMLREVFE